MNLLSRNSVSPLEESNVFQESEQPKNNDKNVLKTEKTSRKKSIILIVISVFVSVISITAIGISIAYLAGNYIETLFLSKIEHKINKFKI